MTMAEAAFPPTPVPPLPAPLAAGSLVYADADAVAARGAACLDGTRPAFYLWPGAEPTKFVLFLEGGGWCFTEKDCLKRSKGGLGSSAGYHPTMADAGGIMSANATQNPHFSNWTKAFLKYCDGSSMSGARVGASNASGAPLHYRGRANLDAVLDTLAQHGSGGMGATTEVVLSGGSAGGLAAILHLDHVASRMPAGARVVGLPDAGYFADLPNTAGAHVYRGLFQGADPVWNATAGGGTHAACLASTPAAQQWQCLMAQYVVAKTATPLFVMNAAIDVYQVQNTLQVGCVPKTCSAEQLAQMETYRTDFVTSALAPALANPANGAWVDSCIMHEQNVYYCSGGMPGRNVYNCQGWQEEQVNGVTPQQAFLRWYMGAGDHFTIDSASWPSNPTCSWHPVPPPAPTPVPPPTPCADFSGGWYDNSSWYTPVVFAQDGCSGTMQGKRGGAYTVRGDTLSAPALDGGLTATLVRNSTQAQDAMEFSNGAMWERNHTAPPPAAAAFNFSHVYSDSMVLQRAPPSASVWGYGSPGARVTVEVQTTADGANTTIASAATVVTPEMRWRVSLPPQPASTAPVQLVASMVPAGGAGAAADPLLIRDVLFGDVYVCSGNLPQPRVAYRILHARVTRLTSPFPGLLP